MPSAPIATARIDAIDRVVEQLQAHLEDEVDAISQPNLPVPVPADDEYFFVGQDIDQVIHNHDVAVFVYPTGGRRTDEEGSGGAETGAQKKKMLQLEVTLVARRGMVQGDVQGPGKVLSGDGVLRRRMERYLGAIINVVWIYCQGGEAGLIDVDLVNDVPQLFWGSESSKPLWGTATATFDFKQKVKFPLSQHA
jgi:hypothetical protein